MQATRFFPAVLCAAALFAANTASAGPESFPADAKDKNIVPVSAPVESCDWSGFYAGGNIGGVWNNYDFGSYEVTVDQPAILFPPVTFSIPSHGEDSEGALIGGGQVGLNKQWGHFVVGLEGDFQGTNTSRSQTFADTITQVNGIVASDTDLISIRRVETNWLASARARVGFAFGCFLLYGTGGAAFGEVDVTANDTASSTFFVFSNPIFGQTDVNKSRDQDTRVGWTAGGGVEWMLRHSISLGVEYRHTDLGSDSHHFESRQGTIFPSQMDVDFESDQVAFKVNFLFHEFLHR